MGRTWESVIAPAALAALLLALVAELGLFLAFGRFNIDEGMHLGAGRMIYAEGLLPYRDFPFSQGPGGPFFYGALGRVFGTTLLVGRIGSLLAGLVCFGAMLWFAYRTSGVTAALAVALLLTIEAPALWMFTQVRTEPVSVALATLAVLAFVGRRDSTLRAALPAVLLVWATTFRLTYAVALCVVLVVTAWELRAAPRRLGAVAGIVALNGLVAGLPMLAFPSESLFHVIVAQTDRAERLGWSQLPASARFWFFALPETSYRAVLLLLPLPVLRVIAASRRGGPRQPAETLAILLGAGAVFYLPNLWFVGGFFQYFENAALLAILAIGIAFASFMPPAPQPAAVRVAVVAWLAVAWCVGASVIPATLEVWTDPSAPTVDRLAPLRAEIARALPGGCEMLTFETYLAVEAGCRVTPGLEYSYFSFFPDLPSAEAARRGVLDREALLARLTSGAPEIVALTRAGAERILGTSDPGEGPPRLPGMEAYRPWLALRLPVGPLVTFWNDVYLYARADVPLAAR